MLVERQLLILQSIIDDFIDSGQPVASKSLLKQAKFNISSATIRNEMSNLEEMGYIEKPHTSAGRVPSEKGYRYYVDYLLHQYHLTDIEAQKLQQLKLTKHYSSQDTLKTTALLLSELTDYATIVLPPATSNKTIKKIELILLDQDHLLIMLIVSDGQIKQQNFNIPYDLQQFEITYLNQLLNDYLFNVNLTEVYMLIQNQLTTILKKTIKHYDVIINLIMNVIKQDRQHHHYVAGKMNLFKQPDLYDVNIMGNMLYLFEQPDFLQLIEPTSGKNKEVKIGKELNHEMIRELSIVSKNYHDHHNNIGTVAIIGPKRMNYNKVICMLDLVNQYLETEL